MIRPVRPLAEITETTIRMVYRELGAADAIRFFSQFRAGTGNYTEERETLLADWTLDDVLREAKKLDRERQGES